MGRTAATKTAKPKSPPLDYAAPRLARMIGKPNTAWAVDDLIDVVKDQRIRMVSFMHIGGDGTLKTLDFVPHNLAHLQDILYGGERADGSSIFAGLGIVAGASDVVLRPRPETAFLDPFAEEPTLVLLCEHLGRDGKPLPESPDTVLRAADARLKKETGIDLWALGEVEFFLGKTDNTGHTLGRDDRGYHAASPFVFGEELRRDALLMLAEIGIPVKYGHSEVGYIPAGKDNMVWEQHEVEMLLQPLPRAAESVALTHWVLCNLAAAYDMRCSFDPIVQPGHAGNGMHFHLSPVVKGEHQAVFAANGKLQNAAKWLIGGLVQYGGVLMAFGNRNAGSFLRLSQGKEAPNTVTWGQYNRKALVRLPIVPKDHTGRPVSPETVEYRLPDGSAHAYLLLAGVAQAMVAGKQTRDLDDWIRRTATDAAAAAPDGVKHIPRNFGEIVKTLELNRAVFEAGGVFPERQIESIAEQLRRTLHEVPHAN